MYAHAWLQLLREELMTTVTSMASTGLRTLCLAYTGELGAPSQGTWQGSRPARLAGAGQQSHRKANPLCV